MKQLIIDIVCAMLIILMLCTMVASLNAIVSSSHNTSIKFLLIIAVSVITTFISIVIFNGKDLVDNRNK